MARKNYPDEFKRDAVALYRDTEGATITVIAAELGVSEATLSRMKRGDFLLQPGTKPFELALLFVRLYRSLDAIVGGEDQVAASWLAHSNTALNGKPLDKIQSVSGLIDVIAYLDARRALV